MTLQKFNDLLNKEFAALGQFEDFCMRMTRFIKKNGGELLPVSEPNRDLLGFVYCKYIKLEIKPKRLF